MIILVATCGIYGKIRVRTLLITERAVEFWYVFLAKWSVEDEQKRIFGNPERPACRADAGGQSSSTYQVLWRLYTVSGTWRTFRAGGTAGTGDPHLIAKTLIDTDDGSTQEDYGEYSSYGSSYGNETELPHQQEKRWKKVIDLSTWHGRAVVIAAAAVIIILLILIIGVAIPFLLFLQLFFIFFHGWRKEMINENLCRVSEKKPCAES